MLLHLLNPKEFLQHEVNIVTQDQSNHAILTHAIEKLSQQNAQHIAELVKGITDNGKSVVFQDLEELLT